MRLNWRLVCLLLLKASGSTAQDTRLAPIIEQLSDIHSFAPVSISPDGRWITYNDHSASGRETYLFDLKATGASARRVIANEADTPDPDSVIAWSPDSTRLAFFADSGSGSGHKQLFVAPVTTAKGRQLTNVNGYVRDIHWSPDGKQLAFLYAEGGGAAGPLEAAEPQTGAIGTDIHNQRIAVVTAEGGDLREVSPRDLNVYEYDWSPDNARFAALAAPGPADNNWWIAQLYLLDLASGTIQPLYRPPAERQIAIPRWSPDGKQIAFLGGLMSDEGFNGGDLFVMSSSGGDARNLTVSRKSTPSWFAWRGDGELIFTEMVDGGSAVTILKLADRSTETLWRTDESVHDGGNGPNFAVARDGRTGVVIQSTWQKAPEVWAGPIGDWREVTHSNSGQQPLWGKSENVIWTSDGLREQGWLLYPDHYDSAKRYPMIVSVHGGPSNIRTASWPTSHFDMSVMASLGYFVFFPNPRGSYGQGESFTRANVKDFGGGDLRDVLVGVDAVLAKVPVDSSRVGIAGWSYGGYMTMWAVTQTNRFHAAVAGAGIANWLSYYGENSIDEWMIPFFGASVYDDPAVYAKSSPMTYIKQVKTPTLVIAGERDGECPAPQSFEFWHALKALKVPTELVVYPGEGHSFRDEKDNLDRMRRTAAWFDKYLLSSVDGSPVSRTLQ